MLCFINTILEPFFLKNRLEEYSVDYMLYMGPTETPRALELSEIVPRQHATHTKFSYFG